MCEDMQYENIKMREISIKAVCNMTQHTYKYK